MLHNAHCIMLTTNSSYDEEDPNAMQSNKLRVKKIITSDIQYDATRLVKHAARLARKVVFVIKP